MKTAALLVLVACSAPQQTSPSADRTAPTWFRGVWKLEWARDGNEPPTQPLVVRDVQSPTLYGSVRIPKTRPTITAQSFDELTDAEIEALLAQRGFAGSATFDNGVAVWAHDIDFQPRNHPDTARLTPKTPTIVSEKGLDGTWEEMWWNLAPAETRFLAVETTRDGRVEAVFVVVGDHFHYARNRRRELPTGTSLAAIAAGKSRAEIIELLDCELSYGRVHGGRVPWEIVHSTLPWRESKSLDAAAARAGGTELLNTFAPEDLAIMFARSP